MGALECPVRYLVVLLSPALQSDTACLLSAQRALRISHVSEDILCVWHPKIDVLQALTAPLRAQDTRSALLIQVLDSGNTDELQWLGKEKHNYGYLLRVTIPRNPALLVVRATLKDLAAYWADISHLEALNTLASYLLSWAATIAPFDMLTAEQLLMAAASDDGALQAARILSRKQRGGDLTSATARQVLVQNVCRAITRAVKQAKEGLLISSIVQRFLLDLPLRLLVLLLGRLLPLLRSTATTGALLLEASGKASGKRAGPARIMHTMAKINPQEHSLGCVALSAEVCGLRHYRLTFWPPITSLAHFHSMRKPPQGSKPDGNVRFAPGTLLLLEVSFAAPHGQGGDPRVRHLLEGPAAVEAIRGRHGFTLATTPIELPEGPWPRAASSTTDRQCVRSLDPDSIDARILLNQGQWTAEAGTGDISATAPGLLPFVVHETKCTQPQQRDPAARQRAREACNAAPWGLIGYFLDPALFEMLARTAQLSLPAEPFHAPRWREATMHDFTVSVHHVMRVGHLASPMVWRSLLYPSPARLPLAWGVTQLPLPMPHDLSSPDMVASSKWLVRALLTLHADSPTVAVPSLLCCWRCRQRRR